MMPFADPASWSDYLRQTLRCYGEPLLRRVAAGFLKPRNQWPAEELIERTIATLGNAAGVDRRLNDLDVSGRRLLACIGHSRQPRWKLGNLLELLAALGCSEGPQSVIRLFEAGLLYPDLLAAVGSGQWAVGSGKAKAALGETAVPPTVARTRSSLPTAHCPLPTAHCPLRSFEQWLRQGSASDFAVFAHPLVTARALGTDLGLPVCSRAFAVTGGIHEADGLEWPLRLAAVWQLVTASPLRRTQQGGFFKRDLERLRSDSLLNAPPADNLLELPDAGLLAVCLAHKEGVAQIEEEELRAGTLPPLWEDGLPSALESLWMHLPLLQAWNPLDGWSGTPPTGNPYPSAYLLLFLLLASLPADAWAHPQDLEQWLLEHHPYWGAGARSAELGAQSRPAFRALRSALRAPRSWVPAFLLGFAYQLRMLQAAKNSAGEWLIRLSPLGRWLLGAKKGGEKVSGTVLGPPSGGSRSDSRNWPKTAPDTFSPPEGQSPVSPTQTLLVQPNLEIVVYRQALTPGLIARLGRFATWKSLGSACTLQLQAATVYRALETGFPFESILQTLEQHGMRAMPPAVIESLRTWADKRERISVYPSATLFEFGNADDLNEALARGLPGVRLSERMLVVVSDKAVDFRHFRLTGTRDYALPPEKCVVVEADGVTLAVDVARSDLLLEAELHRFAESLDAPGVNGEHRYRLTPTSLAGGRNSGLGLHDLDEWFMQRSARPLSAAARLLLDGFQAPPLELRPQLVLHVSTPELAEGLLQWPGTRALIRERLGPTALAVAEEDVELLRERLETLGVNVTR